jgi:predicted HTH domain antitoxin
VSQGTSSVPDHVLRALRSTPDDIAAKIRFAAAVKLYEIGELSSAAAAGLAGVPKPLFLSRLSAYGVSTFDLTEEELLHDRDSA